MINEEILEVLQCAHSEYDHFVIEPITLPNCGHSICKKCIPKDHIRGITCKICGLVSQQDLSNFQVSKGVQKLLQIYLEDLFKIIEIKSSLKLGEIQGIL